jgi:DASS family divalent anion:Na+ symporter
MLTRYTHALLPAGYLTLKEVFSYGALMSVVNLLLWGVVGGAWWKFMGFF